MRLRHRVNITKKCKLDVLLSPGVRPRARRRGSKSDGKAQKAPKAFDLSTIMVIGQGYINRHRSVATT